MDREIHLRSQPDTGLETRFCHSGSDMIRMKTGIQEPEHQQGTSMTLGLSLPMSLVMHLV